jgi:hypothetical protein
MPQQNTVTFTFTVIGALTITSGVPTAQGSVGTAYPSFQFTATGGTTPYTWTATGLPGGLTLSTSGLLSGTPTASGNFNVSVTVTDSSN